MKHSHFILIFLCLALGKVNAQLSIQKDIKSEILVNPGQINYVNIQAPDLAEVLAEDEAQFRKDQVPRFGVALEYNIDLIQEGKSDVLPDGSIIYRTGIQANGAKSLNFIFNEFDLPKDAWMHIYDPSKKTILGAFTDDNEKAEHSFATTLITSEKVIFEVYFPKGYAEGKIELGNIIYGYRDIGNQIESFGSSGNCNVNVSCPEGNPWSEQIRSVVLILSGGSNNRMCSGTMINNTLENGKPYMLTANHCPISTNNVVIFNYQSPTCNPSKDSSFAHSINGLSIKANWGESDFLLTELNGSPPNTFNVYYSGWNNSGQRPKKTVGIHHPQGDVKKISFDYDRPKSSSYYSHGNTYWQVVNWDLGTTEVISSGSPLFDENKMIVGQLHGGDASCSAPKEEDYYGKFSHSWNTNPNYPQQLKRWLDPTSKGASKMYGYDPQEFVPDYDVALLGNYEFDEEICDQNSFTSSVLIKNRGKNDVDKLLFKVYLNNILRDTFTLNLSSPLAQGEFTTYKHQAISASTGIYTLKTEVEIVGKLDANKENNVTSAEIRIVNSAIQVEMLLKTDNSGSETSWELRSATDSIIYEGGGYKDVSGGELIIDTFCLPDGCFSFNIFDDYGDGTCCAFGQGYYILIDIGTGDTIIQNYNFTTSDTSHNFCLGDSCAIIARSEIKGTSSSGSSDGEITLEMISGNPPFSYNWSTGTTSKNLFNVLAGFYYVIITDSLKCSDSLSFEVPVGTTVRNLKKSTDRFKVYPNPNNGFLNISGLEQKNPMSILVYDLSGQIVYEEFKIRFSGLTSLNLSELNNGLYILQISSNSAFQTERIIKQ